MKRTIDKVDLSLYAALFLDIAAWDSDLLQPLTADYSRLVETVNHRGVRFSMIDMPEAGRTCDVAFSRGYINFEDLPGTFGRPSESGYRPFLGALFARVFDGSGKLLDYPDLPTAVFFLRAVLYLTKKVERQCENAAILAEVETFKDIDRNLRSPTLEWNCTDILRFNAGESTVSFQDAGESYGDRESTRRCLASRKLLRILDQVSDRISSQFGTFDFRQVKPRHGPGAVADAKTGTDKYLFPHWPQKLETVFPFSFFGMPREDLHHSGEIDYPSAEEPAARLLAVPKTLKGPRMIASEPVSHQFIQLGLMRWLREHLPKPIKPSISFLSQEPSRLKCLEASKSGEIATVDLSAASDRLTCWVVERVFRRNPSLLEALWSCRTRSCTNATSVDAPWTIDLNKFAPMGSGVTFPVQTIVYTVICVAVVLYLEGRPVTNETISRAAKKVQVFGDDIVLPSSAVPTLAHLLSYLDLKVNGNKTHYSGHFRESCGMDAFKGVDVTPLYASHLELGDAARNLEAWVDVCNNAYSKGLWCLANFMVLSVPLQIRKRIPVWKDALGCLTLRTNQPAERLEGKTRISKSLHRPETLGVCIAPKVDRRGREGYSNLLQYFVEEPSQETNWSSGYTVRKRTLMKVRWVPW